MRRPTGPEWNLVAPCQSSTRSPWRLLALALVLIGVVPAKSHAQEATNRWETLQAIHLIENPTNTTRVGRNGELGPYQFRPSTWRMHTKKPFRLAANRQESDRVAVKHYEWIKRGLERGGVEPSTYHIALAWNAGLDATLRGLAPKSSQSYAERVESIAGELRRQQLATQP